MSPNLDAPLSPDELASLREVSKGPTQGNTIPTLHKNKLIALGFASEKSGVLALTNDGRFRLAAGR